MSAALSRSCPFGGTRHRPKGAPVPAAQPTADVQHRWAGQATDPGGNQ